MFGLLELIAVYLCAIHILMSPRLYSFLCGRGLLIVVPTLYMRPKFNFQFLLSILGIRWLLMLGLRLKSLIIHNC
jgi:hypothetical protein